MENADTETSCESVVSPTSAPLQKHVNSTRFGHEETEAANLLG